MHPVHDTLCKADYKNLRNVCPEPSDKAKEDLHHHMGIKKCRYTSELKTRIAEQMNQSKKKNIWASF